MSTTEPKIESEHRVIKKYPNRRLYDTAVSSYITLGDVRNLVLNHSAFVVRDAKTNEDITRSILLQIIIEQEEGGEPIFTTEVLTQIIRFYGDTLQGFVATYLDRSLGLLVKHQHRLRQQMQDVVVRDPVSFFRELTEQNLALWKDIQASFRTSLRGTGNESAGQTGGKTGEARSSKKQ